MTMPNFLIISGGRAGTTSLYNYLGGHPQIYVSTVKEPHFFCFEDEDLGFEGPGDQTINRSITNLKEYCALFDGVTNEKAIGEASTFYLYSPKASERIKYYIPDVKLIVILRHPADRAYSAYLLLLRLGYEPIKNFEQALKEKEQGFRRRNKWFAGSHYLSGGYYYAHLKRYFDMYNQDQIKVFLYEDLKGNSIGVAQNIFKFLGVDDTFIPDVSVRHNKSTLITRNNALDTFISKPSLIKSTIRRFLPEKLYKRIKIGFHEWNLYKPEFTPEKRMELIQLYRDDILKLQDLIQRDLSKWLNV